MSPRPSTPPPVEPKPIYLGVNVDHVATIRQARGADYPDPVEMALIAEDAGANGITMHLREDRRHVVESDIVRMAATARTKLNMEMAATDEMRDIALRVRPADACIVPERRAELTTEGGLDVVQHRARLGEIIAAFSEAGIRTSLFIAAKSAQIDATLEIGAPVIELHTGKYANAAGEQAQIELAVLADAAKYAAQAGLIVNAGHGLHYQNAAQVATLPQLHELNIGHAIVARAIAVGFHSAVSEMKRLIVDAREIGVDSIR